VALIGVVTMVSRIVGFGRTAVMSQSLGASCLGSAYTSANAIPNLVFEMVVGGALAGAVVPLLAGAVERGNREVVSGTVRALTGWVLLVLVPIALLCALLADPIVSLLLGDGGRCDVVQLREVAASMLRVFAIQIPVYGLTVIAQGTLNAHHRFFAPAVAPLLSSVVVIAVFLTYSELAGEEKGSIAALSNQELALLAWGTTLGVIVLWLTQLPSLGRTGLLLRWPRLAFPAGVALRARRLAAAGFVTVSAQWLAFVIGLRLANDRGIEGAGLVYLVTWTVFLLPWAVLAYPVVTGAVPRLSAHFDHGRTDEFTTTSAAALRAVVTAGFLGAAGLVATSSPVADLMLGGAPGPDSTNSLQLALVLIAPAVLGFSVLGQVSRVLFARHQGRKAALLVGGGWLVAVAVSLWLTAHVDSSQVVAALGAASSAGMMLAALFALLIIRRELGSDASAGLGRAGGAALVAALVSSGVGWGMGQLLVSLSSQEQQSTLAALVTAGLVAVVVVALFGAVMLILDGRDLRSLASSVRN